VEANRRLMPIDHITGWLFRVARSRITDLFRKKMPERLADTAVADEDDDERLRLEDLLPRRMPDRRRCAPATPDEPRRRSTSCPEEQRAVFVAHGVDAAASRKWPPRPA
jgi:DNA-directed RNA polymerase specialized sigma24 family protein